MVGNREEKISESFLSFAGGWRLGLGAFSSRPRKQRSRSELRDAVRLAWGGGGGGAVSAVRRGKVNNGCSVFRVFGGVGGHSGGGGFRSPDCVTLPNRASLKKALGPSVIHPVPTGRPVGAHNPSVFPTHRPTRSKLTNRAPVSDRGQKNLSQSTRLLRMRRGDLNFYHERCGYSPAN